MQLFNHGLFSIITETGGKEKERERESKLSSPPPHLNSPALSLWLSSSASSSISSPSSSLLEPCCQWLGAEGSEFPPPHSETSPLQAEHHQQTWLSWGSNPHVTWSIKVGWVRLQSLCCEVISIPGCEYVGPGSNPVLGMQHAVYPPVRSPCLSWSINQGQGNMRKVNCGNLVVSPDLGPGVMRFFPATIKCQEMEMSAKATCSYNISL